MNKTILLLGLCAAIVFSIGILMVFNTTSAEVLNKSLETSTHGARRWVTLFGYTLQPSEFAKYLIPIYFINKIEKYKYSLDFKSFILIILLFAIPISLILIEPDTGTTLIIISTLVVLFFITRIKFTYWVLPLVLITIIGAVVAFNMPHVPNRIKVYLHPEMDLKGRGHQPYQAKIAVGSGKLVGRGLVESLQTQGD